LAGIDLLTGKVHALVKDRHRSREFIEFLRLIDAAYPPNTAIKLILDNHSAHLSRETRAWHIAERQQPIRLIKRCSNSAQPPFISLQSQHRTRRKRRTRSSEKVGGTVEFLNIFSPAERLARYQPIAQRSVKFATARPYADPKTAAS
jgi:transposase